ncbi:hypothetical protein GJR96_04570 [Haloferax sp. MBLA0076]|uniref:Sulfotransferase domain-containing protein n=1 Tax=Haloferax litoreum TaxID=2666140 RepID=A0A6A8GDI4_9EURY|nr:MULTISPECIES: sulfotransferase [Haloferax]KAB1192752.1 sulfotransferase domain-containing protein [Haloferax sp. CBA1148]MRX21233.1 hypothetical protein [Haloferax litoreum]
MTDDRLPNFLHIGAQKAGSTWIHFALKEHPEIFMPDNDNVGFFDTYYHRGDNWYQKQFDEYDGEKVIGEESPGYIKHPLAPQRAADLIPDAKIVLCVRNPMDRAYSQWWHAQKNWTNTPFEYTMNYHAANSAIIVPGFYDYHISRWEEYYPSDQIKIVFFDDFTSDNKSFIQDIYGFLDVDDKYSPSIVGKRIKAGEDLNEPGALYRSRRRIRNSISEHSPDIIRDNILRPMYNRFAGTVFDGYQKLITPIGRSGYQEGMDPETRQELEKIYYESIKNLEERTGRNLDHWFEYAV